MEGASKRTKCRAQPKQQFERGRSEQLHEELREYELPVFESGWSIYL
jgi:hypothetical protein